MALRHDHLRQRVAESGARRSARIALVAAMLAVGLSVLPTPAVKWIDNLRVDRETLAFDLASAREMSLVSDPHDAGGGVESGGQDRVVSDTVIVEEFVSIGVSPTAAPTGDVLIRWSDEGAWSDWTELEISGDEGPDLGSSEAIAAAAAHESDETFVSQPIWVGDTPNIRSV